MIFYLIQSKGRFAICAYSNTPTAPIIRLGVLIKLYHSFTLLASIFIKIKSKIVKPQSPEPPYEKKGNGTPMVGKTPKTIAIFTKEWMNKMAATH